MRDPLIRPICAILLAVATAVASAEAGGLNLVSNGDFSQIANGRPVAWQSFGDDRVDQRLEAVADGKNPCVRLVCTRCDPTTPASHAMLAQVGVVRLTAGRMYEFACRVRAEGLSGGVVGVAIRDTHGWKDCGLSGELRVGAEWREQRTVFKAPRSVGASSRLQFWFREPGALYVDDVRIVEMSAPSVQFTDVVEPAGGTNLVPNGSFEAGAAGWSSLGQGVGWGNLAFLQGHVEATGGTDGRHFLRIPVGADETPVLGFDYLRPQVRREIRPLAASIGWIRVSPGKAYTLSGEMRADVDGVRAVLGVRSMNPEGPSSWRDYRGEVTLGRDWRRETFTFTPAHRYLFVTVGPDLVEERRVDVDIDAVQLEAGTSATRFASRRPVEAGVEPSSPGGLFVTGAPARLRLFAANHTPVPQSVRFVFEAVDYFDTPVSLPGTNVDVAAHASCSLREIDLPSAWQGYYRVTARWSVSSPGSAVSDGPGEAPVRLALAFVPPRRERDSLLGMNHAFAAPDLIRMAGGAGIVWYRDWSFKWQDVEPKPGAFRWESVDPQIDRVLAERGKVLALIPFPSAGWISEAPPGLATNGYPGARLREAWAPRDRARLDRFVGAAVERYRERVHAWEFLNEPLFTDYALPGRSRFADRWPEPLYAPKDYVDLLAVAAAAMKRSDPSCRVIGGIAGGPDVLARDVIAAGCLKHVDIFNLHLYPGNRAPEAYVSDMEALLRWMDAAGGRKPIWVTEFSYYGADRLSLEPWIPDTRAWADSRLLANERECAEWTVRFLALMLSCGVEKVFIHSGGNSAVNMGDNLECCLFDARAAPRKVLAAVAVFTDLVGAAPTCAGRRNLKGGAWCVALETSQRAVLVLWDAGRSGRSVTLPAGTHCLDLMGRPGPEAGVVPSACPVYVVGDAGRASELMKRIE